MNRNAGLAATCAAVAFLSALGSACATNPVSGNRELVLMSEAQEIEMGREADKDVIASIGLYPNADLQLYVQALGSRLAAASERPHLPWTFRVVDDPAVNAFAIPGGFVYVTRGILAHMNSEAELVAVLGHEIGHVTARHSVSQMSRQQLAQVGLLAGMILSPRVARFGGAAQAGLGLMFLKFGRADESQADRLGMRYMLVGGYDPREMTDLFRMLSGVTQQAQTGGRLPQWLASHPDPENREAWAETAIASLNRDLTGLTVNRREYVRRLDGLVFGENPREGYFEGEVFRHPDLAFRLTMPIGWKRSNEKQSVSAMSAEQDAIVVLRVSSEPTPQAAARKFFAQDGIVAGESWRESIGGMPAVSMTFRAASESTVVEGLAAWVSYKNRVFQVMGYASDVAWPRRSRTIADALASFDKETDPAVLRVEPRRLKLVELSKPATMEQLLRDYPSTVPTSTIGLINNLQPSGSLQAGESFKRVVGGPGR
jgi:predicted Zn-dependent protease